MDRWMYLLEHLDTNQPLVLMINAFLCIMIISICICRLNAMTKDVLFRVRLEYVVCITAGFISMGRPYWGENVGWASLMLESAMITIFLSSSHAWRPVMTRQGLIDTPPASTKTDLAPLEIQR